MNDLQQFQTKSVGNNKTLVICLALLLIAVIAVALFKVSVGSIALFSLVLACPLMHILMMRDGKHKH